MEIERGHCSICHKKFELDDYQMVVEISSDDILMNGDVQPNDAAAVCSFCLQCEEKGVTWLRNMTSVGETCVSNDSVQRDNVFCQCDFCQKSLCYGDTMRSLTMSVELICASELNMPLQVEYLSQWCLGCESVVRNRFSGKLTFFGPLVPPC